MLHFHIVVCVDGFEWKDPVDPKECIACEPGEYGLSGECLKCPAGYFSSDSGQANCDPCPCGEISNPTRTGCIKCPANTFEATGAEETCTQCPSNSLSPEGSDELEDCGNIDLQL